jgi:hypothetical protein
MRLFLVLLIVWFVLQAAMFVAGAARPEHPIGSFALIPAVWIAMGIGGVHSAGFWSVVLALLITSLVYASITSSLAFAIRKLTSRAR